MVRQTKSDPAKAPGQAKSPSSKRTRLQSPDLDLENQAHYRSAAPAFVYTKQALILLNLPLDL